MHTKTRFMLSVDQIAFLERRMDELAGLRQQTVTVSNNRLTAFLTVASASVLAITVLAQAYDNGAKALDAPGFRHAAAAVLGGVLLLGMVIMISLIRHDISRAGYLRAANLIRGYLALHHGLADMVRLPLTDDLPPMSAGGSKSAFLFGFPSIVAVVNTAAVSAVAELLNRDRPVVVIGTAATLVWLLTMEWFLYERADHVYQREGREKAN